jgi:hypothetical protein
MTIISNRVFSFLTYLFFQVSAVFTPRPLGLTLCVNANIIRDLVIFASTHAYQVSIPFFISLIFNFFFSGLDWVRVVRLFERTAELFRKGFGWARVLLPYLIGSFSLTGSTTFPFVTSPSFSLYVGCKGFLVEVIAVPVLAPWGITFFPFNTVQLGPVILPLSEFWHLSKASLPFSPAGIRRFCIWIKSIKAGWTRGIRPVIYFIDLV